MQVRHKGLVIAIVILLALSIIAGGVALAQSPFGVRLFEQNDSGESGSATLTEQDNGMMLVEVTIENAPAGVSQPMHIHEGTCADINPAPKFPLTNLENGTSTTEISATIQILLDSPHAINGHKSAEEASVYVFCGDIIQGVVAATVTSTPLAGEATTEATAAATEEATLEATSAATTEPAEATPTVEATQLPNTGGTVPWNGLIFIAMIGGVALVVGLYLRQSGRRV